MRLKPKDVAILLDRLLVLFERPVRISESRHLSVRSELSDRRPGPDRGADAGEGNRCRQPRVGWTTSIGGRHSEGGVVELLIIVGYVVIPAVAVIVSFAFCGDADSAGGDGMILGCFLLAVPLWPTHDVLLLW